jgi:hypothetical protein
MRDLGGNDPLSLMYEFAIRRWTGKRSVFKGGAPDARRGRSGAQASKPTLIFGSSLD